MKDQSAATHPRPRRTVKFQVQSGNTLPRPFGLGPDFSFSVAAQRAAVRNSLTSRKTMISRRNFGLGLRRGGRSIELPIFAWRRRRQET